MSVIAEYIEARRAGHPAAGPAANKLALDRTRRLLAQIERQANKPLLEITVEDALALEPFFDKYQNVTRTQMLSSARRFYEWAAAEGRYARSNPFWFVGRSDNNPHHADRLPWNELRRVFTHAPKAFEDERNGKTVQLIIGLLGLAGMRIEEIVEIQKDDVRDDGVVVRRDGRFVPLTPKLMSLMQAVMKLNGEGSPYVIRGNSKRMHADEPMTAPPINVKINKVYESLGLDRSRFKPMSLRETFIARAEEKLDNPALYYTLVGHPQTRQPSIPAFTEDEIRRAYEKVVS